MARRPRVTVRGLEELDRQVRRLRTELAGDVRPAALAGAEVVAADMRARAPRRTGALADHIITEVILEEGHKAEVGIGPDKDRFYGGILEVGSVHFSPKPFMRPALDTREGEAVDAVADVLRAGIRRVTA